MSQPQSITQSQRCRSGVHCILPGSGRERGSFFTCGLCLSWRGPSSSATVHRENGTGHAPVGALLRAYEPRRPRDLQREINEGLKVVLSWNRANSVIFFGKGGDIAINRRDEQEPSVLCLRVLQGQHRARSDPTQPQTGLILWVQLLCRETDGDLAGGQQEAYSLHRPRCGSASQMPLRPSPTGKGRGWQRPARRALRVACQTCWVIVVLGCRAAVAAVTNRPVPALRCTVRALLVPCPTRSVVVVRGDRAAVVALTNRPVPALRDTVRELPLRRDMVTNSFIGCGPGWTASL